MDPLTMMMLGSTALSGLGSWFGGKSSAKAAREAAARQSEDEKRAISILRSAGSNYNNQLGDISQAYDPYVEGGMKATNQLYDLLGLNGNDAATAARGTYQTSPGYDWMMGQGVEALDRSAAARGMLNSGRASKDLLRFGEGLASQDYNNYLGNLSNLGNQGYNATGARAGLQAQGATGQLGVEQQAGNLQFKNAATVPQGMIAAQNAENAGLTGALGALNYGVGQFQGMQGQDQLSKLLGNTSRGSSFGNFAQTSSPFSFGAAGYTGMGPFLP